MKRRTSLTLLAVAMAGCGGPTEAKAPIAAPPAAAEIKPAQKADDRGAPRDATVGPDGEKAEIVDTRVKITAAGGGEEVIEAADLHPPPGDRVLRGISPTTLLFLDDGTLLVGSADGTVAAIRGGRRRHSLGFRGAIRGLTPAGDGVVAVTTALGVMALITGDGKVRWERQVTAEPLGPAVVAPNRLILAASQRGVFAVSLGGESLFSHASPLLYRETCNQWGYDCSEWLPPLALDGDEVTAGDGLKFRLDDPHPPVPSLAPTYPLTFHKVLDGTVKAVLAGGSGDVWALVKKPPKPRKNGVPDEPLVIVRNVTHGDEFAEERHQLVHVEGARITRFDVPFEGVKNEVFVAKGRAEKGAFHFDGLVAGPDGAPWIVARRINWERTGGESGFVGMLRGAGQFLEPQGTKVRERRDHFGLFLAHEAMKPIAVSPEVPVRFFCVGAEDPVCAAIGKDGARVSKPPARILTMHRIGADEWMVTPEGKVFRGERFTPVPSPDKPILKDLGGAADNDIWGAPKHRWTAAHWDGSSWTQTPVPAETIDGFAARAKDDVWLRNARARWDGKQWSRVFGAPPAAGVIARAQDDVWIGGEGLFHGTAPGPTVVRLPAPAAADEGAIADPGTLALGAPETGYAVERMRIAVDKEAPLTEARNISASADGVLWLQTWNRLVELDGEKAKTIRRLRRHSFERWAVPEAQGRGFILDGDELARTDGRAPVRERVQLDAHRAVAIDANKQGSVWLVGTPAPEGDTPYPYELSPHALVRADGGFRPVIGLPSATWCAVAAAPDGGAFFAGGLNAGPAGEGILFHARGRLGSEGTARFRAPATLFAVTAAGPDEAWAAGAAGTVIHVRGGAVERYVLPSGEWLRSALAVSPNDVWIGGDEGTLLHFDGRVFHPVAHGLDAHASITGLAFAAGAVWAVGPSGIVKITRRP